MGPDSPPMRSALALGIVLLGIVLLLDAADRHARRALHEAGPDQALVVVAAARGHLLPAAPWGAGPERLSDVILVGDRSLRADPAERRARVRGLRVATIAPGLVPAGHRSFDVAASPERARAFAELCSGAPHGTVLVVASSERIRPVPGSGVDAATLQAAAKSLGSRVRPFDHEPASWAIVALREGGGWVKLAEAFSVETGVCLSFTLAADPSRRPGREGETLVRRLEKPVSVSLYEDFPAASRAGRGTVATLRGRVGGVPRRSLLAPLRDAADRAEAAESSLVWEDVSLGGEPSFQALVGIRDADREGAGEVRFAILVDGADVGRRSVGPDDRRWQPFVVDLAPWAGRMVELTLRTEVRAGGDAAGALWGEPRLRYGPRR